MKNYGQHNYQNLKNLNNQSNINNQTYINNQSNINNQSGLNNQSYLDKKTTNNYFRGSFNSKVVRKTEADCNDHSLI